MKRSGVLILLLVLFCLPVYAADDPVVAKIGDKKILLSDLNRWMSYDTEEGRKVIEKDPKKKASLLRQIVTGMVIAEEARQEGFDRRPDVKENTELLVNNMLSMEYLDKIVAAKVEVTDEALKKYYEDNRQEFKQPERVRARHILVKVERTASDSERTAARGRAEKLLEQAKAGGDFAALAAEHSEDAGSKRKGGEVGPFARGSMAPEFEEAAFSLKPGDVSGIVETDFGFHIIRVEERKEASFQPYDEVKDRIRRKVTIERKRQAVNDFVEAISKERGVEFDMTGLVGGGADPHMQ